VEEILDQSRQRIHDFHERNKPEMKAIQDEQVMRVRAILNPAQQTEYDKLREERDRKRRESK